MKDTSQKPALEKSPPDATKEPLLLTGFPVFLLPSLQDVSTYTTAVSSASRLVGELFSDVGKALLGRLSAQLFSVKLAMA